MIIHLKQLYQNPGEVQPIDCTVPLDKLSDYKGIIFSMPIAVKGSIENHAGVVYLKYSADFALKLCCDRCLKEFERNFSFSFEHIVVRSVQNENDEYIVSDGDKLDLDELVVSDLLLQLPTKVLCRDDCRGLCYICGADLNESECSCNRM